MLSFRPGAVITMVANVFRIFSFLFATILYAYVVTGNTEQEAPVQQFFEKHGGSGSAHTNNWAVLVCSSRYWFNYRVSARI